MMKSVIRVSVYLICSLLLSACVSILDAVKDEPIEPDPGKRSFGAYVDDNKLETVIALNLKKTGPGLDEAHIEVKVFNGVALLTGEVPSRELKQLAGETARDIPGVRQVHNELLIKANSTFLAVPMTAGSPPRFARSYSPGATSKRNVSKWWCETALSILWAC